MILTGHEQEIEQYMSDIAFGWGDTVYVFGAGVTGGRFKDELSEWPTRVAYIDNDLNKVGTVYNDSNVISLDEYMGYSTRGKIIIAVSEKYMAAIQKQLLDSGLVLGRDFLPYEGEQFWDKYFPVIALYSYGKSYVSLAQISLTERCTLKCRKCAHACYAVDISSADLPYEEACRSADAFFSKVDYIREFVLIGGEPLLYKRLADIIGYIGERYRRQIGLYTITTNGTIVPSEDVLNECKKNQVVFRISDYRKSVPRLNTSHKKIINRLEEYGIKHIMVGNLETLWKDYGFEYVDRKASPEELMKVFDECHTPCREIQGNKFYYCVMAHTVSKNLQYHVGEDDYLDFNTLQGKDYKKDLLKFNLGYSRKGYLDMCNYCHGAESINYPVVAAEQI